MSINVAASILFLLSSCLVLACFYNALSYSVVSMYCLARALVTIQPLGSLQKKMASSDLFLFIQTAACRRAAERRVQNLFCRRYEKHQLFQNTFLTLRAYLVST